MLESRKKRIKGNTNQQGKKKCGKTIRERESKNEWRSRLFKKLKWKGSEKQRGKKINVTEKDGLYQDWFNTGRFFPWTVPDKWY